MYFCLFPAAQREKELCGTRSSQYVASQTLTEADFDLLLFFYAAVQVKITIPKFTKKNYICLQESRLKSQ